VRDVYLNERGLKANVDDHLEKARYIRQKHNVSEIEKWIRRGTVRRGQFDVSDLTPYDVEFKRRYDEADVVEMEKTISRYGSLQAYKDNDPDWNNMTPNSQKGFIERYEKYILRKNSSRQQEQADLDAKISQATLSTDKIRLEKEMQVLKEEHAKDYKALNEIKANLDENDKNFIPPVITAIEKAGAEITLLRHKLNNVLSWIGYADGKDPKKNLEYFIHSWQTAVLEWNVRSMILFFFFSDSA
jgi:hypothetical protein